MAMTTVSVVIRTKLRRTFGRALFVVNMETFKPGRAPPGIVIVDENALRTQMTTSSELLALPVPTTTLTARRQARPPYEALRRFQDSNLWKAIPSARGHRQGSPLGPVARLQLGHGPREFAQRKDFDLVRKGGELRAEALLSFGRQDGHG
jgi:hypothetical protein